MTPEKKQIQFLSCVNCQGRGKIGRKKCFQCGGTGTAAWTGKDLFYWGKKINNLQIAQDQLGQIAKNVSVLSLLLFGIIGIIMLVWVLSSMIETQTPWQSLLFEIYNWQLLIFWLSMLTNCYLFYFFQREFEAVLYIPKKKYKEDSGTPTPISWAEIKNLKAINKINIIKYFTVEAEQTIVNSWQIANKYEDEKVNPIHLFVALINFEQIQIIFSRLGISFPTLKSKISRVLALQLAKLDSQESIYLSDKVKQIIFESYHIAYQLREKKVEVTELLEALVSQQNEVNELLYDLNIDIQKIRNVIAWLRIKKQLRSRWSEFRKRASLKPKTTMNRAMTAIATPVLDALSQDMTLLAQGGYLMPCINREKEFEAIFNTMASGQRRSVLLVGNPGVGKNTIMEGLAQRMVEENIPESLQDKRLVSLSLAKLVSGADATSSQQRLMLVINEIRRSGNIILYIGDIHNMIGITAGRKGSMDLADVLSQALSHNNVICLASTTPADYQRYIESKSSLDNVFDKVDVDEVEGDIAIQILESKAGTIEQQDQIFFSYDAIEKTVQLADRFLHDRFLPEKAIAILQEVAAKVRESKGKDAVVSGNDVSLLISEKTNIPLSDITKEESEKLLNLEERIHQKMIDQEEAVKVVAASLRRARAELRDAKRPIVNLLFLGPTGVGKTELAKTIAEVYFGAEENMIRLDMSEYQEKNSINRLIGLPLGSGSEEIGSFAEAVRKNPFSLILLDEIEKAHPDILNVFLQVMDDGRLTDTSGRIVDFTNSIIIATSNAGTKFIQEMVKQNKTVDEIKEKLIDQELNQYFRPEFLNRFDGIIVFKPLSMKDVQEIAKLMLKKVKNNLEAKGIKLKATLKAVEYLSILGFDPEFGARPLRRVIQEKVQDPLANYLLSGQITRRDIVTLDTDAKIIIEKAKEI